MLAKARTLRLHCVCVTADGVWDVGAGMGRGGWDWEDSRLPLGRAEGRGLLLLKLHLP